MVAHVTARPTTVSSTLPGRGQGSVAAESGASAALAGFPSESGFTPLEFLDAALSGCLVLSVRTAARKRGWSERLKRVDVTVRHEKAPDLPSRVASFSCSFEIAGDFTAEERATLIAEAHELCTVGNTFAHGPVIRDVETAAAPAASAA